MKPLRPIKRGRLIKILHGFGFKGPFSGGKHQYMVKNEFSVWIPNPHEGDIGIDLLARIIRQAGIDRAEWDIG